MSRMAMSSWLAIAVCWLRLAEAQAPVAAGDISAPVVYENTMLTVCDSKCLCLSSLNADLQKVVAAWNVARIHRQ